MAAAAPDGGIQLDMEEQNRLVNLWRRVSRLQALDQWLPPNAPRTAADIIRCTWIHRAELCSGPQQYTYRHAHGRGMSRSVRLTERDLCESYIAGCRLNIEFNRAAGRSSSVAQDPYTSHQGQRVHIATWWQSNDSGSLDWWGASGNNRDLWQQVTNTFSRLPGGQAHDASHHPGGGVHHSGGGGGHHPGGGVHHSGGGGGHHPGGGGGHHPGGGVHHSGGGGGHHPGGGVHHSGGGGGHHPGGGGHHSGGGGGHHHHGGNGGHHNGGRRRRGRRGRRHGHNQQQNQQGQPPANQQQGKDSSLWEKWWWLCIPAGVLVVVGLLLWAILASVKQNSASSKPSM